MAMWREWRRKGLLRVYVGECEGSRSVSRPRKKWSDTVKDCLRKEVWMSGKKGEWCKIGVKGGVCEGECMGHSPGD